MQKYTAKDIDKFRQAGRIAARALRFGLDLIEPGASHLDVSRDDCERAAEILLEIVDGPASDS